METRWRLTGSKFLEDDALAQNQYGHRPSWQGETWLERESNTQPPE